MEKKLQSQWQGGCWWKGNCSSKCSLARRFLTERKLPGQEISNRKELAAAMAAWPGGCWCTGNCVSDSSLARRFLGERKLQQRRQPGQEVSNINIVPVIVTNRDLSLGPTSVWPRCSHVGVAMRFCFCFVLIFTVGGGGAKR